MIFFLNSDNASSNSSHKRQNSTIIINTSTNKKVILVQQCTKKKTKNYSQYYTRTFNKNNNNSSRVRIVLFPRESQPLFPSRHSPTVYTYTLYSNTRLTELYIYREWLLCRHAFFFISGTYGSRFFKRIPCYNKRKCVVDGQTNRLRSVELTKTDEYSRTAAFENN